MRYSDEIVDRVREANNIVDVVGSYVRLTRRGANYFGLCPFHNEKSGSFSVNANMQIYKCFGCGKAGNVFTFLMEYDNLTFGEAVKELADRAGIALPEIEMSEAEKREQNLREKILEVNKEAATYYYHLLRSQQGEVGYRYLTGRALSDDTIKNFGLGFAKYSDGLYKHLKSKGFSDDILKASGMFMFSERGICDKFWNRVMFPIMDRNGKVIAFGGRIMGKAENAPKYLNSPETKAFIKGDNLYGLHLAKHSRKDYMLLCEGYMDTIALHQAGFDCAVASLGTALTPKQAKLISRYVTKVYLTYDSDEAGCKAILRAIPILKDAGITARVVNMKPYKDPDEFIKALGAEAYEQRIKEAVSAFDFEAQTMRGQIDTKDPAQKTKFDQELARKLAKIEDELERNNYIEAAARDYGIDYAALVRRVNQLGREEYMAHVAEETQEREKEERRRMTKPEDGMVKSEQLLVSMLANNPDSFESVKDMITEEDFKDPLCNRLVSIIFGLYRSGDRIVHASIVCRFNEVEDQEKVAGILNASLYEANIGENERKSAFADLVVRVLSNSNEVKLSQAVEAGDGELVLKLMTRKNDIDGLRSKLLK